MKKLTLLVLRSFAGPLLVTFLISLFVLLMQFLWKYIDDLVGKGLDWIIIFKLMVYVSVTLVPLALPLSILISSIMTFGNLAEHFELTACKSAGISLQRVMRPLIVTAVILCGAAFFFSNNILPVANLKMNALLYDVRQQKPALLINEGVYYSGIDGYSIKIGKKDSDGKTLHDITIYDHTQGRGNTRVIMAASGTMLMSEDERFLLVKLFNGNSYEEQYSPRDRGSRSLVRTSFEQENLRFDLSSFKLTRTNEQLFKDNYQMLNLRQLRTAADSISGSLQEEKLDVFRRYCSVLALDSNGTFIPSKHSQPSYPGEFINTIAETRRYMVINSALYAARNLQSIASDAYQDLTIKSKNLNKHEIEWNRKFTLSFAILILFFIGAPLGAIIRKGGLGMPIVVSIIFFVLYHVLSISGEKFAREGVIAPYKGMWISSLVLLPIGIFLTYKATTDSVLFDRDAYLRYFKKLTGKKT